MRSNQFSSMVEFSTNIPFLLTICQSLSLIPFENSPYIPKLFKDFSKFLSTLRHFSDVSCYFLRLLLTDLILLDIEKVSLLLN